MTTENEAPHEPGLVVLVRLWGCEVVSDKELKVIFKCNIYNRKKESPCFWQSDYGSDYD